MTSMRSTLAVAVAVTAVAPTSAIFAADITPGNLLISTGEVLYEYTTGGVFVQNFEIPYPGIGTEDARDVATDALGKVHVYNGTFDPYLSTLDPVAVNWSHQTFSGWSTVNNGTYGGIATLGDYVFVTDMETFGAGDTPKGVVRFDLAARGGGPVRFAETIEPIDLTIGFDGLLYALHPGGSPEGRILDVYDPTTLAHVRTLDITKRLGHTGHRSVAVNAAGEIFLADWDNDVQKLDADGTLLDGINVFKTDKLNNLYDISLSCDGTIAVGARFGEVLLTDENFSFTTTFCVGSTGIFVHLVRSCAEDFDGDCSIGITELLAMLAAWGTDDGIADVNGDGTVDIVDLLQLLSVWGECG